VTVDVGSGTHLLVEYAGCNEEILDDAPALEALLREAALAAGARVVAATMHRFVPRGASGVVVLEESHVSIHTWPEHGRAAVDFYTCGHCDPEAAHAVLRRGLEARSAEVMSIARGSSLEVRAHRVEVGEEPGVNRHDGGERGRAASPSRGGGSARLCRAVASRRRDHASPAMDDEGER
jgi:S-adenosylmethionine decarboxylase proenzyme